MPGLFEKRVGVRLAALVRPRDVSAVRQGFSLIETVAVLLITGLLIAIVQPSLASARRQSKFALCLDRLAAIGAATATYSNEDPINNSLPVHPLFYQQNPDNPSFIGAYEWGGKSGVGQPGFVAGAGGENFFLTGKYGTKAGFGPTARPLNNILYPQGFRDHAPPSFNKMGAILDTRLELDSYRCPSDDRPPLAAHCADWIAHPRRSSYDHFGTSYNANIFMISYVGGGEITSNSPYLRPVSRVPSPGRTLLYDENIGRWAWTSKRNFSACRSLVGDGIDPGPTNAVPGWHGKNWTFNRVFVDGHVATQKVFIEGTGDEFGFSEHYRNELVYPDSPDRQANAACVIIRGDGWQIDTLPAAAIRTGLGWNGDGRVSYENCVTAE